MVLTISTTHHPATDLGFLLHKHPDREQSFTLPFGKAQVFHPEAPEERCTVALLIDIDGGDEPLRDRSALADLPAADHCPPATSQRSDLLEHPEDAFAEYRREGVPQVICEEKHMGSRAVVIVCRDEQTARDRFGVAVSTCASSTDPNMSTPARSTASDHATRSANVASRSVNSASASKA